MANSTSSDQLGQAQNYYSQRIRSSGYSEAVAKLCIIWNSVEIEMPAVVGEEAVNLVVRSGPMRGTYEIAISLFR